VGLARTTQSREENDIFRGESPHARTGSVVASFYNTLGYLKSLPAEVHHFRHERQPIQSAMVIQGLQDFAGRLYFDKVTGAEV
jgi:hypothetical protein